MKTVSVFKLAVSALAIQGFGTLQAAETTADSGNKVSLEVTPKAYYFDYYKGVDKQNTQFLERYNYQMSGGDNRSGFYPDADLRLRVSNPRWDLFSLDRQSFGIYNQRGKTKLNTDWLAVTGYYSMFRSATGGVDFLYSPNQFAGGTDPAYVTTGSGYVSRFNDDSGQTLFKIDRSTYGGGLALKPELFGRTLSAKFNFDGYQRDGNRFARYALGGSDVSGGFAGTVQRWRGFDMPVNEQMNRYSINLSGAGNGLQLVLDGAMEKFNNRARDFTIASFAPMSANIVSSNHPIDFVPDSTLFSSGLRMAKSFGHTSLAAGYGMSLLEQDSFTQNQLLAGYDRGEIMTNNAYLNINSAILPWVGLEGFAKYYNRANDSTFPADGLISATTNQTLGVRINTIQSFTYGASATFRPPVLKSTVTVGWKGEDKYRDLTWTAASTVAPLENGIQPQRSLYQQQTLSNEGYVNWVMRPLAGLILRITPSYLVANQTGLITEPAESFNLKTKLNYAFNENTSLSAFYNYRNKRNDNNSLTYALTAPVKADGSSLEQNTDNTQQSSGLALSYTPYDILSTTTTFSWMRNDFSSYFISSNRRRFEAPNNPVWFQVRDTPNYLVDTYVFSVGADLQVSKAFNLSSGYTLSQATGHNASGYIASKLTKADEQVDNILQTFSLGGDYALNKSVKLKGSYAFDYYDDKAYSRLTGGYHSVMMGVSLGF